MKKILITGGSGFIGSNLVKFLIKKKFFVINIDKIKYSYNLNRNQKIKDRNYSFYKFDINDKKKLFTVLKKYKPLAIFNLAAETHVDRSIDNPFQFIESNILGVYNILECIKDYRKLFKKEIKIIHVSTDEVYGDIKNGNRSDETFPYHPSSPYSASKASADHLIKAYIRTYNLKAVISNCCNNYGPGQFPEKFIPTLIYKIINKKPLPIYGKGKNSREWIHVYDHCEALFQIYKKGVIGQSYNVGTGMNLSNLDLAKRLIKTAKKLNVDNNSRIEFVKDRPGHDFRYALNSKKIHKQLGWKPTKKLDVGLNETFQWYLENGTFFNSFSKKLFYKRLGLKI
jgi:dTDP-glucose 4,6-dehydratase